MYSHIILGARDLPALIRFYSPVLQALGLERMEDEQDGGPEGAGWQLPGQHWPQFYLQMPFDGKAASVGNGTQVSFRARSRAQVDAAWAAACLGGGRDEGAPGLRPQYGPDYYGAYCRDPEGHKLCFVFVEAFG
ncbi:MULTISPECIES: VOC family protein [unclassified Pseudomonas]|uniref:VOC family protein n=1 Tax=unclassified Pseudomonas TaxID=196821 RepID=UPI000BDC7938|nr:MULTISPECIES: VOC family protein [unclassified Pseudomonas]PVZ13543.1 catechol 2,3-dioxygenase-like lactoylglutathione lyase family enzyme [Pseudomonas sp. URIL14HWK12:I12]PVZ23849.1 catechol 2,3-dioxygenase-like lactoylglutathione lyase family enzyme [Pseudomonas sp. URIL14HWK12:I10]PVZ33512.1 catechol 2,3-dioxygenase-like lactoylglutathione lyase family enzyme [Pseudomonas sp. URIL14HWK12:I11]SNZ11867.1 Catechol 2,3-dioxygenase [Pseudomonas sp. URIL14HWK12:I9]